MIELYDTIILNKDIAIPEQENKYIPAGSKCTVIELYKNPKYIEIEYTTEEHNGTLTIDADNDILT